MSVYSIGSLASNKQSSSSTNSLADVVKTLIKLLNPDASNVSESQIKALRIISSHGANVSNFDESAALGKISRYLSSQKSSDTSYKVSRALNIASQFINLNVSRNNGALLEFIYFLRGRELSTYQPNILSSSNVLLSAPQSAPRPPSSRSETSSKWMIPVSIPQDYDDSASAYVHTPSGRILLSIVQGISNATVAAGISLPHPADNLSEQLHSTQDRRLDRLAAIGWLCGRLRLTADGLRSQAPTVISRKTQLQLNQLIAAAIATAADTHLSDYARLLANIEGRCSNLSTGKGVDGGLNSLTPLRLETQLFAAGHQLRLLTGVCETVADILHRAPPNSSATILSYLYQVYESSSDEELKQRAGSLLIAGCRPLYRCMSAWLNDGRAPFGDFFIFCDPNVGMERFWADRFQLKKEALPCFIEESLAAKMLLIGKAIHYATTISNAAEELGEGDGQFDNPAMTMSTAGEYAAGVAAATGLQFPSADTLLNDIDNGKLATGRCSLFCYVDAVYRQLARDLLAVVIGSGSRLAHNLIAIKAFILMSRGDFAARLVTLAAPILDQPAERVFVPGLRNSVLDTAIRSTVVDPCPFSLLSKQADRVDCRLLQASPRDSGWDVFRLEWRIDPRLAPVLSPDTMQAYARLSNLLVAMRHSHHALTEVWLNCRGQDKPLCHIKRNKREEYLNIDQEIAKIKRSIFVQLYATASELRAFVDQTHYYIYLEVIEPSFIKFQRYCASEEAGIDLDGVIVEHKKLLNSLLISCLLQPHPFVAYNETPTAELLDHLRNVLQHCHQLLTISKQAANCEQSIQAYRSISASINICQRSAREHIKALWSALAIRKDPAQRCLAFRLDSSGFYSRRQAQLSSVN